MTRRLSRRQATGLAAILLAIGAGFVLLGGASLWPDVQRMVSTAVPTIKTPSATPRPTATEPILPPPPTSTLSPTDTPEAAAPSPTASQQRPTAADSPVDTATPTASLASPTASATPTPTATPIASATPERSTPPAVSSPSPAPQKGLYTLRQRLGLGVVGPDISPEQAGQLGFGWYLDWRTGQNRFQATGIEYMPMIRLMGGTPYPDGEALLAAIDAQPGALWLIGNEPDVKWQDSVVPDVYAQLYHDLYATLKARDPTCQVAIGGVSQPTPLRLRYLDLILEAYQARYGEPMPVDVWNVHNFVLREERDSWGVDIPPGMNEQTGTLYEISDHDDMAIFGQQIVDFRRWMKTRGLQDKPLIVTEYGILMPNEYGFPPARVERFMLDTFEFFRTATDPNLGYPADGYRLVQRWCWFSLGDLRNPSGNLLDPKSGQVLPLGDAFSDYAHADSP